MVYLEDWHCVRSLGAEHFLFDDDFVGHIGFLTNLFGKFARYVGDSPIDEDRAHGNHVLEDENEGEPSHENIPIVERTFVFVAIRCPVGLPKVRVAANVDVRRRQIRSRQGSEIGCAERRKRVINVTAQRMVRAVLQRVDQSRNEIRCEGNDQSLICVVITGIPMGGINSHIQVYNLKFSARYIHNIK